METKPKQRKLVSMIDFVLEVVSWDGDEQGWEEYFGTKFPSACHYNEILDQYKIYKIEAYAKFLNQPLTLDMFIGEKPLFSGFVRFADKIYKKNNDNSVPDQVYWCLIDNRNNLILRGHFGDMTKIYQLPMNFFTTYNDYGNI